MGRCGCADKCECKFKAGNAGISITGAGSLDNPVIIGVNTTTAWDTAACSTFGPCASTIVGPGTGLSATGTTDGSKIRVDISSDPTNTVTISPIDRGIYKPPGVPPTPAPECTTSVAALPTTGLIVGRSGYGENVQPWNTLKAARAAVDSRLQAIHIDVSGLGDGTSVLAPYYFFGMYTDQRPYDGPSNTGPYQLPGTGQNWAVSDYGNLGPNVSYEQLTVQQWKVLVNAKDGGLYNPAGWPGWFGGAEYLSIGGDTTTEMLDEIGGKIVVFYRMPRNVRINSATPTTFNGTPHPTFLAAATSLRSTILRHCVTQTSVVLAYGQYQDVNTPSMTGAGTNGTNFKGAGIEVGVWLEYDSDIDNNPPATLKAQGVKWVFLNVNAKTTPGSLPRQYAYGEYAQEYVAQGLSVVYTYLDRRVNKPTETKYGARGVCSVDPLYYAQRDGVKQRDTWAISLGGSGRSGSYMSGQLHDGPDGGVTGYVYRPWVVRGEPTRYPADGSLYDGGYQLPVTGRISGTAASATVLGWACPIPDPTNWMMTWEGRFVKSGNVDAHYGGIMFSLETDARIRDNPPTEPVPANFYLAGHRENGEVFLGSNVNGTSPDYQWVNRARMVIGQWYKFKLVVSPNELRLYGYDQTIPGPNPVYSAQVSMTNSAHRFGYVALVASGYDTVAASPIVGFRNVKFNMGDGDPWYQG